MTKEDREAILKAAGIAKADPDRCGRCGGNPPNAMDSLECLCGQYCRSDKYALEGVTKLAARVVELEQEVAEHEASLSLRHRADMRGIKMWQGAKPGRELTWPNHGDLVCWLLKRIDAVDGGPC